MEKKISEECPINSGFFNVCEFIGSMFLVIAAVSPLILFVEILKSPIWIAVAADSLAVGFVLFALIEIFGPICTAYFNPVVSIAFAIDKRISWVHAFRYSLVQIIGGITGLFACHIMFYDKIHKIFVLSSVERTGGHILLKSLAHLFWFFVYFRLFTRNLIEFL